MVQLSATRCSCIAILWVSLVSFAAITLCVASQQVFIVVSVYFVMTQSGNFWILPRTGSTQQVFVSVGSETELAPSKTKLCPSQKFVDRSDSLNGGMTRCRQPSMKFKTGNSFSNRYLHNITFLSPPPPPLAPQPSLALGLLHNLLPIQSSWISWRLLNNFLFYRVGLLAPRSTPTLEDQASVFTSSGVGVVFLPLTLPVSQVSVLVSSPLRDSWPDVCFRN
jgi:hypothetical protein